MYLCIIECLTEYCVGHTCNTHVKDMIHKRYCILSKNIPIECTARFTQTVTYISRKNKLFCHILAKKNSQVVFIFHAMFSLFRLSFISIHSKMNFKFWYYWMWHYWIVWQWCQMLFSLSHTSKCEDLVYSINATY